MVEIGDLVEVVKGHYRKVTGQGWDLAVNVRIGSRLRIKALSDDRARVAFQISEYDGPLVALIWLPSEDVKVLENFNGLYDIKEIKQE
jgi:hypothetical protein